MGSQIIEKPIVALDIKNVQYPESLRNIFDPPEEIFMKGTLPNRMVAVVGSRLPSSRGIKALWRIVPSLVAKGYGLVSGLAIGTDTLVHEICLAQGGITVAVLPGPLDKVYPKRNLRLAERIVEADGALVSEYPLGVEMEKNNFLARNRIVAGLSEAVIVTEAGKYSGSISTPNFAVDQGKEVFCVGAKLGEPNSEGILALLEDGARLVDEIL